MARSRPVFDLKQSIGLYEFSVVPRARFAADGLLHHCVMLLEKKLPQLTFFHPIQMYLYWQFIIIRIYVQTQISLPERVLI